MYHRSRVQGGEINVMIPVYLFKGIRVGVASVILIHAETHGRERALEAYPVFSPALDPPLIANAYYLLAESTAAAVTVQQVYFSPQNYS
jgi:hypothetical protein